LEQLRPDEEVVVVDAKSTDGTQQYLSQLLADGKIHQYLSEPDRNQAHGWNKAILLARGTVIKKIIDDDVFCYDAIRQCKAYMLQNNDVDVVISNDLASSLRSPDKIDKLSRLPQFTGWNNGAVKSFTFGDVHMLVRRSSLAYIGLYNTSFTMMDWEYSLRISYNKANIAYYTGYNALNVAHEQTITSAVANEILRTEGKRGAVFYEYSGDDSEISQWSKIKIWAGNFLARQKRTAWQSQDSDIDIAPIYEHYYSHLQNINSEGNFTFLTVNHSN
jgi:glycosyltransferase involved in cell wall biosynthesis